jgi:molecular chaperone HscB
MPDMPTHPMKLDANDFDLFGLPLRFEQDRTQVDARWKALQAEVHPDRFAAEGPAGRRIAMQWSVRVNEAYARLKDPLRRAAYLCELHGATIDAESNTAMPAGFLMQQMQWREALDEAGDVATVEALNDEVLVFRSQALGALMQSLDDRLDWAAAAQQVRALMFVERFAHDVDRRLDSLGQ